MHHTMILAMTLLFGFVGNTHAVNEAPDTSSKVFRLAQGEQPGHADLSEADWLIGSWEGTAFGKRFEAHWSPPSADSMLGLFKLMDGDDVQFFEILMLHEADNTLNLRVKHFNPDFSAWEEKTEHTNFRLIRTGEDALHFSGISFYRVDDNRMEAYLLMRRDGESVVERLDYQRVSVP